jgi:AcrR family transcriptional regulator
MTGNRAPSIESAQSDGRRRRSERSRARIIGAMFTLVRGGDMTPSAAALAQEANVGIRTVFRHFDDVDGLYREMGAQLEAEILPILQAPYEARAWKDKLDELITRRIRIYEHIMPLKVAGALRRFQSDFLMEDYQRFAEMEHHSLRLVLPVSIAQDATLVAALELTTCFNAWRRLRQDQGLSRDQAEDVVRTSVKRLIRS